MCTIGDDIIDIIEEFGMKNLALSSDFFQENNKLQRNVFYYCFSKVAVLLIHVNSTNTQVYYKHILFRNYFFITFFFISFFY